MKIIAAANNKGGVGKTKASILLAEFLSKYKKQRVLIIDFDPQCNISQRFLKMDVDPAVPGGFMPPLHPDYDPNDPDNKGWDGRSSIANMFFSPGVIPYPTYLENLDIAPGHADQLLAAEAVRRNDVIEKVYKIIETFFNLDEVKNAYDVVIIDTAPSKGPLTVGTFKVATHVIIPCVMEEQPIQGIYGMLQLWMQESIRRSNTNPLNLIGILPNMFRQINLHKDMLEGLKLNEGTSKYVMPVKLSQRAAFAEVDSEGATPNTVFDLPDSNPAKQEALAVCEYITKRIFNDE